VLNCKDYKPVEVFGMTVAFVLTIVFIVFLSVLTYGLAKIYNLI